MNEYGNFSDNTTNEESPKFNHEVQLVTEKTYEWDIDWRNLILFIYFLIASTYGMYLLLTFQCCWQIYVWVFSLNALTILGTTAGSHRLWSHNSYKAKLPLKIFLAFCQSMAYQHHIYEWASDHRLHHRYSDTDADPYNPQRGFFFAQVGWLLLKKHKDVIEKSKSNWLKDLQEDPVVMFQKRYYLIIMPICSFILPTVVPWYFWGESLSNAWYITTFKYSLTLNSISTVNSFAHSYGLKPYDKNIMPTENIIAHIFTLGSSGCHNFHHAFPWDYKSAEINDFNFTTYFINLMGKIGQAYDLKSVPDKIIKKRKLRTGDGSKYDLEDKEIKYESYVCDDDTMSKEDKINQL